MSKGTRKIVNDSRESSTIFDKYWIFPFDTFPDANTAPVRSPHRTLIFASWYRGVVGAWARVPCDHSIPHWPTKPPFCETDTLA